MNRRAFLAILTGGVGVAAVGVPALASARRSDVLEINEAHLSGPLKISGAHSVVIRNSFVQCGPQGIQFEHCGEVRIENNTVHYTPPLEWRAAPRMNVGDLVDNASGRWRVTSSGA